MKTTLPRSYLGLLTVLGVRSVGVTTEDTEVVRQMLDLNSELELTRYRPMRYCI